MLTTEQIQQIEGETELLFPNNTIYIRGVKDGYLLLVGNNNNPSVFRSMFIDQTTHTVFGSNAFSDAVAQLIEQENPQLAPLDVVQIMTDN